MHILSKRNLAAIGGIVALVALYHLTPVSRAADALVMPFVKAGSPVYGAGQGLGEWFQGVFGQGELRQRIREQDRIIAELTRYAQEAGDELSVVPQFPFVSARVVAVQAIGESRVFLLDKGAADGVTEGSAVATPQGVFAGAVFEVYERFSLALPATDEQSAIAGAVLSNRSIEAVVRGKGGLGLGMELISQDAPIKEGDVVVTSLLEDNTPQGLLVGTVTAVAYAEGELFKSAELSPFIRISDISEVAIFAPAKAL
ncbi:MAG: rod shape-determining protein MreC [Patescibacteria group bacterium]|nr:rod shape-determining protein MreC [bacterium]MDZ4221834.1 rod shape-determining protein MreC [Patescibacteria group bacterium]